MLSRSAKTVNFTYLNVSLQFLKQSDIFFQSHEGFAEACGQQQNSWAGGSLSLHKLLQFVTINWTCSQLIWNKIFCIYATSMTSFSILSGRIHVPLISIHALLIKLALPMIRFLTTGGKITLHQWLPRFLGPQDLYSKQVKQKPPKMYVYPKLFFSNLGEGLEPLLGFYCPLCPHWTDSPFLFAMVIIASGTKSEEISKMKTQELTVGKNLLSWTPVKWANSPLFGETSSHFLLYF